MIFILARFVENSKMKHAEYSDTDAPLRYLIEKQLF